MGRTLAKALRILRIRGRFFRFNPMRLGANLTLSLDDTKATESGADVGYVSVYASEATPGRVFRAVVGLAHPGSGSPSLGVGTSSAVLTDSVGAAAGSAGINTSGTFSVAGASGGATGISYTTGDTIDIEIGATGSANAGKLRFRKNGGAYSSWFAHGLSGTVYLGVGFRTTTGDNVTGVWLS